MTVLAPPLDRISREARPYPADMLPHGGSGLLLFAAGFLGVNDAIHFARRRMVCMCVDTNRSRLDMMRRLYPANWAFTVQDAWQFAKEALGDGAMWDAVSVDTFTGEATDRSLETLDLWCAVARHAVTATVEFGQVYTVPDGWSGDLFPRSDRAAWLVLRRD